MSMRAASILILLLLLGCAASHAENAYVYSSGAWSPPTGVYAFNLTLWGAGGGGAVYDGGCAAGGGSGAAILSYPVNTLAWPADAQWLITIGQGGPAGFPTASDGQPTSVVVTSAVEGELLRLVAYAGGGGVAGATCTGGGGGGASSSASGSVGGSGSPAGANGNWPTEGATLNGIKAGSSGGGGSNIYNGANWGSEHTGGAGMTVFTCRSAGGAAGFNGNGPDGYLGGERRRQYSQWDAAPNTGAGGATSYSCGSDWVAEAGRGGSGGFIAAFVPLPPSPSATPSSSPSSSPTASSSPSSSPTASNSPSSSPTASGSPSGSPTASSSPTRSPTPSRSPSSSPTRSPMSSPSRTPTQSPTRSPSRTPSPQPFTQKVSLQAYTGKYLASNSDFSVTADRVAASSWETWTVTRLASGKFTIKSYFNRYLSAQPDGSFVADRTVADTWEQYDLVIRPTNRWSFKTYHGTYLFCMSTGFVVGSDDPLSYYVMAAK